MWPKDYLLINICISILFGQYVFWLRSVYFQLLIDFHFSWVNNYYFPTRWLDYTRNFVKEKIALICENILFAILIVLQEGKDSKTRMSFNCPISDRKRKIKNWDHPVCNLQFFILEPEIKISYELNNTDKCLLLFLTWHSLCLAMMALCVCTQRDNDKVWPK